MFFREWSKVYEIIIMAILFYLSLIVFLRISGKRTLSDLNAFDLVVSITVGSIGATTILSGTTKYFEGMVAVLTLIILQYITAKLSLKSKIFRKIIKSNPTLLYYEGEYLIENMNQMRINEDDILQKIRIQQGVTSDQVQAVILEPNGELSVITKLSENNNSEIEQYR